MTHIELGDNGRQLLDQLFDKWSLLVLDALCDRPRRFNELRQHLPAVTPKSLTACLRRLERNGVIERVILSTEPVAVEYRISPLGRTLQDPLQTLLRWVGNNLDTVDASRSRYDQRHTRS
ncbi:winged helix-turn-helix transcriptional regulator [Streptomyces griseoviridis]|uniref:DNA-binding HxlR family transcriptional regulator n=1 Tax=Streptomyces griseoviridis TaxID=45398 RepID=A0ABT9LRU4_STRGD|nr:helix-turn-helix domain-containing protein [Streptomyces griseoviridis]MDP9686260.1 DNA-binding HxlR family transcriptional regulator [Streptomyces griseoviridis]GGT15690.1 HxlR family transcriptional regulator [Streptomyces griseoviridis]